LIYRERNNIVIHINEEEVYKKIGESLVPYYCFSDNGIGLLYKKSEHGFFVKESNEQPPTIYYNDSIVSSGAKRFTIFHELKHYVYNDKNDDDDDLADYFARHLMCPTAYIMNQFVDTPTDIELFCGLSVEASIYAFQEIKNRRKKYKMALFDYEVPLINHLDPTILKDANVEIIETVENGKEVMTYDCE
ncbi:MAG: ImmA/IrrE family metallo-endopeptidase, partial [Eubacterium sp.]|nr:ImmA/IrrE family metallo-endopeptidase [Eubacterium sp.]